MGEKYCVLCGSGSESCDLAFSDAEVRKLEFGKDFDFKGFFESLESGEKLVVAGDDSALNLFVNKSSGLLAQTQVFYCLSGEGCDFYKDIAGAEQQPVFVEITHYIHNLPSVRMGLKTRKFLNGTGLDLSAKKVLFGAKPVNVSVTVDGETKSYSDVWLVSCVNGRFCCGGMMAVPDQERLGKKGTLSCMILHNKSRLGTYFAFSSIYKGEHVKRTGMVEILRGHNITVSFDRPVAVLLDGEKLPDVSEYSVSKF